MQPVTARVDRQIKSLFDLSLWSSIAVIILIAVSNFVNNYRIKAQQDPIVTGVSPNLVLVVSVLLVLWFVYGCVGNVLDKRRLVRAFVTLDDAGVSGHAIANPTHRDDGEEFSLSYDQIIAVDAIAVAITKKHSAPALRLKTLDREYVIPALENISDLIKRISEHIKSDPEIG